MIFFTLCLPHHIEELLGKELLRKLKRKKDKDKKNTQFDCEKDFSQTPPPLKNSPSLFAKQRSIRIMYIQNAGFPTSLPYGEPALCH